MCCITSRCASKSKMLQSPCWLDHSMRPWASSRYDPARRSLHRRQKFIQPALNFPVVLDLGTLSNRLRVRSATSPQIPAMDAAIAPAVTPGVSLFCSERNQFKSNLPRRILSTTSQPKAARCKARTEAKSHTAFSPLSTNPDKPPTNMQDEKNGPAVDHPPDCAVATEVVDEATAVSL